MSLMKKLLVPTDFSPNAKNALHFAIEMANRFDSEITLLHMYQVYSTGGMFVSVERYMKENIGERMLGLISDAERRLKAGARIDTKLIRGESAGIIAEVAEQSGYDLIVMGTQGASGLAGVFLGSTTEAVMRRTRVPVLAIPAGLAFRPLRVIVLAADAAGISYASVLAPLLHLARRFNAKVKVYHKDTGAGDSGIDPSVDIFLDGIDHSFHYGQEGEQINRSINDFVKENQADLLCMIRRERGFLSDIFHVSATSKEIFKSPVPLLVLHDLE